MEKALSFFIMLLVMASCCHALSMGSLVKENNIKINENETARFDILFWNANSEPYEVELIKKYVPENITIIISPDKFSLDKSDGSEYIYLSSGLVKATPVSVVVIPEKSVNGKYNITIVERVLAHKDGMLFLPESSINLFLEIGKTPEYKENVVNLVIENKETAEQTVKNNNNFYIIIILLIIIIFSLVIYKLS